MTETFNTSDTAVTIPLTRGYTAIVDSVDADLNDLKWQALTQRDPYAARKRGNTRILLHRVIMARMLGRELVKGEQVDHVNGNKVDNWRCNLRLATISENNHNSAKRVDNSSGFKGVTFHKHTQKWCAQICVNNKRKHLGLFTTPELAYEAYCEAARKFHGAFARFE